jgi:hypothetical protein
MRFIRENYHSGSLEPLNIIILELINIVNNEISLLKSFRTSKKKLLIYIICVYDI